MALSGEFHVPGGAGFFALDRVRLRDSAVAIVTLKLQLKVVSKAAPQLFGCFSGLPRSSCQQTWSSHVWSFPSKGGKLPLVDGKDQTGLLQVRWQLERGRRESRASILGHRITKIRRPIPL